MGSEPKFEHDSSTNCLIRHYRERVDFFEKVPASRSCWRNQKMYNDIVNLAPSILATEFASSDELGDIHSLKRLYDSGGCIDR